MITIVVEHKLFWSDDFLCDDSLVSVNTQVWSKKSHQCALFTVLYDTMYPGKVTRSCISQLSPMSVYVSKPRSSLCPGHCLDTGCPRPSQPSLTPLGTLAPLSSSAHLPHWASSRCWIFFLSQAFRPCQLFRMTPRKLLRCVTTFSLGNLGKKYIFSAFLGLKNGFLDSLKIWFGV